MSTALDCDIWIGNAGREQFPQRAQQESDCGSDPPLLLQHVLQLLEDGILQDRVDDQHQSRHDAREQGLRAFLPNQRQQRPHCRRCLGRGHAISLPALLPRRHPRVDDPDGICEQDRRGAGQGARHHRLDGRESLRGAPRVDGGFLEGRARPLVPVVVDEVGHCDAEEGRVEAGVEAGDTLSGNEAADCIEEARIRALRLDLGAGGEGDEGIAGRALGRATCTKGGRGGIGRAYVRVMERRPPPAPLSA